MRVRRCLGGGRVNLGFGIFTHGLNQVGQFMQAKRRVNARTLTTLELDALVWPDRHGEAADLEQFGEQLIFYFCGMLRVGGNSDKFATFLEIDLEVVKAVFEQRT